MALSVHDYRSLVSERETLRRLIEQSSKSNVIGRLSLERRLAEVRAELEGYVGHSARLISASLTFSGEPVTESRGIRADFGSIAVREFSNAVALVGASERSPLPAAGRVPHASEYKLMITGTVLGSFGFRVEDASGQLPLAGETTPVERAIRRVKEILKASLGTAEELEHAIGETDARAVKALGAFVKRVADNAAVCALEFDGEAFGFRDLSQVRGSADRLCRLNVDEVHGELVGRFEGYLPHAGSAEFRIDTAMIDLEIDIRDGLITGKVDRTVAEAVEISRLIGQVVRVAVRMRRIGAGRPRYTFLECSRAG